MSTGTSIEWTDVTWNPTTGCTRVSEGCRHCYIERTPPFRMHGRKLGDPVQLHHDRLEAPLHWKTPRRVFVNSLSDLFHEDVPYEFIDRVFATIAMCPQHVFQVLSKRPARMKEYMNAEGRSDSIACAMQGIGDRRRGQDLENCKEGRTTRPRIVQGEALHQGQSRIFDEGRLSAHSHHDSGCEDGDRRAPSSLVSLQRTYPGWNDDQSQERHEVGQQAGELRVGNVFRESSPRLSGSEREQESAEGIASSKNKDNGERRIGNQETQERWRNDQGYCGEVCNEEEGDLCDLQSENLETHLAWPLPNVWLGVSVEDQKTADERIPILLQTPAAVRWISAEPLLAHVNLGKWLEPCSYYCDHGEMYPEGHRPERSQIDWVVVGGESGPGARECDVAHILRVVKQCKAAGVPVFVKQVGSNVVDRNDAGFEAEIETWAEGPDAGKSTMPRAWPTPLDVEDLSPECVYQGAPVRVHLRNKKGGDPAEWPEDLRIRQYPNPAPERGRR